VEKLLQKIKELVDIYNEMPDVEKMALIPEEYVTSKNIQFQIEEQKISTENLYICKYDGQLGLFFRELREGYRNGQVFYNKTLYSIYRQYQGDNVGLYVYKEPYENKMSNTWVKRGVYLYETEVNVTCNMTDSILFDNVRMKMYEQGEITDFKIGETTQKELLETLMFANKHLLKKTSSEGGYQKKF